MLQFTARLVDRSTAPVTLVVERKEEDGLQILNFSGMAVFKDDVLVGMMDMYQMQGYILSMGEVNGGSVEIITELGNADLKITKSICKQEIQLDNQGNITFKLKVNTTLSIGALQNFRSMDINKLEVETNLGSSGKISESLNMREGHE